MGSLNSFHLQLTFVAEPAWLWRCGRVRHVDSQRSGHPAPRRQEQPGIFALVR